MAEALTTAGIIHLGAVVPALVVGAYVLLRKKGTAPHRMWGRAWVLLMLVADISAFWLQRDGFSSIHIFAVVNLASIFAGIFFIYYKRNFAHAAFMIGAYLGTAAAGVGALAPGRLLSVFLLGA